MKPTKTQFELFKKECQKWIDYFGLKGWDVYYNFEKINEDVRANIYYKLVGRIAIITLNTNEFDSNLPIDPDVIIKRTAFHEVCELMMSRISLMATGEYNCRDENVEEEVHNIIRTLENTIFNKEKRIVT